MGRRGPAPLPSNVHRLHGNPSKLPASKLNAEVRPEVRLPDPPEHLLEAAKAEWHRLGPEMVRLGLISDLDRAAYAAYCQAWARWVQAEAKLKELDEAGLIEVTPSGYKQIGVWQQLSNRAVDQMHKFITEFGLTPSSRARFTVVNPQLTLFSDEPATGSAHGQPAAPEQSRAARHFS
jgi:P27 family predicted phage terminase small subunit